MRLPRFLRRLRGPRPAAVILAFLEDGREVRFEGTRTWSGHRLQVVQVAGRIAIVTEGRPGVPVLVCGNTLVELEEAARVVGRELLGEDVVVGDEDWTAVPDPTTVGRYTAIITVSRESV